MRLSIGEKLMVLRIRKGLSAKKLGEMVFEGLDHPNVKIHKIEAGTQKPKRKDLKTILECLDADENVIKGTKEVSINNKVIEAVPEFKPYVEIINQAAQIDDYELIRSTMKSFAQKLMSKKIN